MENRVATYVRSVVRALEEGQEVDGDSVLDTLADLRDRLEGVYEKYDGPAPEGSEQLHRTMVEGLQLLYRGIEDLELLLTDELPEEDLAESAVRSCVEAEDCFKLVDHLAESVLLEQRGAVG